MADLARAVRRSSADPSSGASTAKPWLCAVTSTLPVVAVLHRLVDAAVAVAAACRCRSRAPGRGAGCRSRCRRAAMPRSSTARSSVDRRGRRWPGRRGRWRRRPRRASTREHVLERSRSRAARAPRCRARPSGAGSCALMPRSSAATVNRFSPIGRHDVRLGRW